MICATHLRSTYFWAASLDGNSRCRHNPSILIFASMFCEKWKRIREGSREKCISVRKYVVHSFLCVKHLLPSSVQLHKGEFYSSTALYKWRKKTRTQDNFGSYLGLSTCQFFLRLGTIVIKSLLP